MTVFTMYVDITQTVQRILHKLCCIWLTFEVLTASSLKLAVLWDDTQRSLVDITKTDLNFHEIKKNRIDKLSDCQIHKKILLYGIS